MVYWLRSSSLIWSKACFQIFLAAHHDGAPAGFVGQFFGHAFVAAEVAGSAISRMCTTVSVRCAASMASCTRKLAAFILRVGEDDDRLAPGFAGQLVVAGQVHGIVEDRAGDVPGAAVPARRAR